MPSWNPRPPGPDEIDSFFDTVGLAFSNVDDGGAERAVDEALLERGRSLVVLDGGEVVGATSIFSLSMTVPGGARPVAGVTMVGVRPTHQRRGILSALMDRQLADLHEGGLEPVAALWAAESAIYGRFGYGPATFSLAVSVPEGRSAFLPSAPPPACTLRMHTVAEARPALGAVYDRICPERVGHFARHDGFWALRLFDPPQSRQGAGALMCVLHETDGQPDGYALYTTAPHFTGGSADGLVRVREVTASAPAAHAALWRFLLDLALMSRVEAVVAVDDPLLMLLADRRRTTARIGDNLWVRLVDVDRALAARSYAAPLDVVLDVTDERCPWNVRRYRLSADAGGAVCEPTTDAADLSATGTALAAAYLGGVPLAACAAAGQVTEHTPGALAAATIAFRGEREPFCPQVF